MEQFGCQKVQFEKFFASAEVKKALFLGPLFD